MRRLARDVHGRDGPQGRRVERTTEQRRELGRDGQRRLYRVRLLCRRSRPSSSSPLLSLTSSRTLRAARGNSKVWDTHSGSCVVTLPHSHIVRTADLSSSSSASSLFPSSPNPSSPPPPLPSSARVLTGGHEKRLRLWDLARAPRDGSDADAVDGVDEFRLPGGGTAHAGTVKKVLWDEERQGAVSMGEDRVLRCVGIVVFPRTLQRKADTAETSPGGGTCARWRRRTSSASKISQSRAWRGASTASSCA